MSRMFALIAAMGALAGAAPVEAPFPGGFDAPTNPYGRRRERTLPEHLGEVADALVPPPPNESQLRAEAKRARRAARRLAEVPRG